MIMIGNNGFGAVGENGFPPFTNCYLFIATPSLVAGSCIESSIAMTHKSSHNDEYPTKALVCGFPPTLATILSAYLSSLYFMGGLVMRFQYGVFRLELGIY
ncbi:hypothetical protein PVL29_002658 [Vitis rotundifolia]|uniref:Uncharacterized protein n=1 Tax=Vitis rotundifolia TaxID=103349 RepID=A0AA39E5D3_VITRO|nr:hypothetical protein PVL29_002658 [Vitis rotundifolia]